MGDFKSNLKTKRERNPKAATEHNWIYQLNNCVCVCCCAQGEEICMGDSEEDGHEAV